MSSLRERFAWSRFLRLAWRLRATLAMRSARAQSLRRLRSAPVRRVLTVCHGNIYRSPFVAEVLRSKAGDFLEIRSAGFHHVAGRPSPERHVVMSRRFGVELESHRSRIVSAEDLQWADAIVLMDRRNWTQLTQSRADASKFLWLGASDDAGAPEIPDPYSMDEEQALKVLQRLRSCADLLVEALSASRPARDTVSSGRPSDKAP